MIAAGASLTKAMWLMVEVKILAQQFHGCLEIGTPPMPSKAEINNALGRIAGYGSTG
jgi:L-fuculose-phosphate aldolase